MTMDIYAHKPKALLIDMDGTLIDTIPMLYEAYMTFLKSYGILGTPQEFQSLMGPSLSEIIDHLQQRYHLSDDRSALLDTYQHGLEEAYEQKINFFPQALETMHYAKKHHIKLALVSSSEKQFIKAFIKGAGLNSLFDIVIASQQGIPNKPHPDLYLKALNLLKLDPLEALAIEDSINGVHAATHAGIHTFWIKHNTFFASNSSNNTIKTNLLENYNLIDDWKTIMAWLKSICDE